MRVPAADENGPAFQEGRAISGQLGAASGRSGGWPIASAPDQAASISRVEPPVVMAIRFASSRWYAPATRTVSTPAS